MFDGRRDISAEPQWQSCVRARFGDTLLASWGVRGVARRPSLHQYERFEGTRFGGVRRVGVSRAESLKLIRITDQVG
jgi:hypothetical protein